MKKKWGALALAGVLGATVVTGCSTGGKGEAAENQTSAGSQVRRSSICQLSRHPRSEPTSVCR